MQMVTWEFTWGDRALVLAATVDGHVGSRELAVLIVAPVGNVVK